MFAVEVTQSMVFFVIAAQTDKDNYFLSYKRLLQNLVAKTTNIYYLIIHVDQKFGRSLPGQF